MVVLNEEERRQLETLAHSPTTEQRTRLRCRIVLAVSQGASNKATAKALKVNRHTVEIWRKRYAEKGIRGLKEAPRPGRPARLSTSKVQTVVQQALQPPPGRRRWNCRSMARHSGVSKSQVQRLWRANGLKPRSRTLKPTKDKHFERKFWDVIGLYLNPPDKCLVLCCDEKGACQALERTQPSSPLEVGHIATHSDDYYRHGTVTLFAALNYLEGKIIGQTVSRQRHQEWMRFLKELDAEIPRDLTLHLNIYSTHKHQRVRAWIDRRNRQQQRRNHANRAELHFVPTSGSWLNLVERFFADVTRDMVPEGSFTSVQELVEDIWSYLTNRNACLRHYVWKAKSEDILPKIQRARGS